jgi:cation transport protein ChaC
MRQSASQASLVSLAGVVVAASSRRDVPLPCRACEHHGQIEESFVTPDPFSHLPHLRDRLVPPDKSELRVTPEVLAVWDQRARELGRSENWRLPDHLREASRRSILGDLQATQDLWVFAYGSLMWDPGIRFAEVRLADLEGHQRRFTYKITVGRGSPDRPALMLSLERQAGCCRGLAFRIAADSADSESEILWRREMLRGGYCPAMLPMITPQGGIMALVFASNHSHPEYVGELPLNETAAVIASASGPLGTNRSYIEQLVAQLSALSIEDGYVEELIGHVQAYGGTEQMHDV